MDEYEGDAYVPHLTLGADFAGDTAEQLRRIAGAASTRTWAAFRVHAVVEFRRAGPGDPYEPIARYPLARA